MESPLRILHLENDADDARLVERALAREGLACAIHRVRTVDEYAAALGAGEIDLVLSDNGVPGCDALAAMRTAREFRPGVPFVVVTGHGESALARRLVDAGAADVVHKEELTRLAPAIRRALLPAPPARPFSYEFAMERLVAAIQDLSLAHDLDGVMAVVRRAARDLTGADGATFVLRDGSQCFYADEDAVAPLWKGLRFPMSACISGWTMLHRRHAAIEDIYADDRIPADAYRPTFVQSLVMVPIRTAEPIGAIGTYWATRHAATPEEILVLQRLADSTSIALENVRLVTDLERRVNDRTRALEDAYRDLESFSYSVSHDLRAPLRSIDGFGRALLEDHGATLAPEAREHLDRIRRATVRMSRLIEDLLELSRVATAPVRRDEVDLAALAREIGAELQRHEPDRAMRLLTPERLVVRGDAGLLRIALENLLGNAWKYTRRTDDPLVELEVEAGGPEPVYLVRDNGAGFDMARAARLFTPFERLHDDAEFGGSGVGLATVARIVRRHGGRVWADAAPGEGATFRFTLP